MQHLLAKQGQGALAYSLDDLKKLAPTAIFAMDIETHGIDGEVGDAPYYAQHGIAGVAICNNHGDAVYAVIDDHRRYGGIPIKQFCEFMNATWLQAGRAVVFHNLKFDVAFLKARGMDFNKCSAILDTWLMYSIMNKCAFQSNALKDIVKRNFAIATDSEEILKNWLKEHNTEDYGDIPIEIIGPYACDDVRYTLAIFYDMPRFQGKERVVHDLLVRNMFHLIEAEQRGVRVDAELLNARIEKLLEFMKKDRGFITERLGCKAADVDDPQGMLHLLHNMKLHPPPREYYGEQRYVLDDVYMLAGGSELALQYRLFARRQLFLKNFSGNYGNMSRFIWSDGTQGGFHPFHFPSVHGKGGLPQVRRPNLMPDEGVILNNSIRELFIPREGHRFVLFQFQDLPWLTLAHYLQDSQLDAKIKYGDALETLARDTNLDPIVVSLWLLKEWQGHGAKLFESRLRAAGIKLQGNRHYKFMEALEARLKCKDGEVSYAETKKMLEKIFQQSFMTDALGRPVRPDDDKLYRGLAILAQSSAGGVIAKYLDVLCRVAQRTGAHLVLAHEGELLFEMPDANFAFQEAVTTLFIRMDVTPRPLIREKVQTKKWKIEYTDIHERAFQEALAL